MGITTLHFGPANFARFPYALVLWASDIYLYINNNQEPTLGGAVLSNICTGCSFVQDRVAFTLMRRN
jgi:hypothetical protein